MCRVSVQIGPDPHIQSLAKSGNHYWARAEPLPEHSRVSQHSAAMGPIALGTVNTKSYNYTDNYN